MLRYFIKKDFMGVERYKTDDVRVWREMNGQWVHLPIDIRAFNVMMNVNKKIYTEVSEGDLMLDAL